MNFDEKKLPLTVHSEVLLAKAVNRVPQMEMIKQWEEEGDNESYVLAKSSVSCGVAKDLLSYPPLPPTSPEQDDLTI